jgi:hypothetical protein
VDTAHLLVDLDTLARDRALLDEPNLAGRIKAYEQITLAEEVARARERHEDVRQLRRQAEALKRKLERLDRQLFARVRANIRSGRYTAAGLRAELGAFTDYSPDQRPRYHFRRDALDVLIDGVLRLEAAHVPRVAAPREADMIHLEPTPARAILDLVDHAGLTPVDVFYDLGSGLGQVVFLVHLLTGVRARGIEIEPAYCEYAQRTADDLRLTNVEFINADVRDADMTDGTVFFLFTPFKGAMLQSVLARLEGVAQRHPISVCTYGPCTPHVALQRWLRPTDPAAASHEFTLAILVSSQA